MKARFFLFSFLILITVLIRITTLIYAATPSAGGDTTVVNPSGEGAVSINEDAPEPESANIRLIVPTLTDPDGGTPSSIRILSVTGGTLQQGGGGSITLGSSGTTLSLSSSRVDLRFKPASNWDENASFEYVVVDPHDSSNNSPASTATVSITAVNDPTILKTVVGSSGTGLAATYYLTEWDLTGSTFTRIDSTVNFSNNFGVPGLNAEQFSVRWTGQIESPITGNVTFSTQSDDGVRLWVDGEQIIDNWTLHGTTTDTADPVALVEGTKYDIQMEFYERGGGEVAILQWAYSGQGTQVIPQQYLFPATIRPALTFINGSGAVVIDDGITISDVDSSTMASAVVEISNNYESAEDALQFTDQNGITGSYEDGTLTLTGSATLAQYQTALRSVKYFNSESSPDTSTRTIRFRVNDGTDDSNYVYRDIEFSDENNPPVITQGSSVSVTMDEDGVPTAFSLTLDATDEDEHSIAWSVISQAENGTASVGDPGNSVVVSYTPDSNYFGEDSFVVQASDGVGGTDTITVNVTVTSDGIDEAALTLTPTSTPTVASVLSASSSTSSNTPSACDSQSPVSAPDLFQISTSPTSATLYFNPINPITGYVISYGTIESADQHSVAFNFSNSTGAISYTINSLDQNTLYFFKVRGMNHCMPGVWSQIKNERTTGNITQGSFQNTSISPTPTPRGTIEVVEKEQTARVMETTTEPEVEGQRVGEGYDISITVKKDGQPVEGATVEVHSTPRKAMTDKDGIARFSNVEGGEHTVYLAYEGYAGEEKITLDGDKKDVTINFIVELKPNSNFFSSSAWLVIFLLLFVIALLLFFLFKKRRKSDRK